MVERKVNDVALELLKAMDEHQAIGREEALVNPYEAAAHHVEGLDPGSDFYNDLVDYLVTNAAIEQDKWATRQQVYTTFYRITRHGFAILNGGARLR